MVIIKKTLRELGVFYRGQNALRAFCPMRACGACGGSALSVVQSSADAVVQSHADAVGKYCECSIMSCSIMSVVL